MPRHRLTDEEKRQNRNAYMSRYMRQYRMGNGGSEGRLYANVGSVNRADAAYDPQRDGAPQYASLTAELCGDPPIGRSALDRRHGEI